MRSTNATVRPHPHLGALIAALMIIALVFTVGASVLAQNEAYSITPDDLDVVGSDISSMSTTNIHGAPVTGAVFAQKELTVLHFFATWSQDCIREMEYMQTAFDDFCSSEIAVYGLLYEDGTSTPESCAALFEQLSLTYGCLRLDSVLNSLVTVYPYIPQTFLVNSNGIVVRHFPGTFESFSELEALIAAELGHPSIFHEVSFIDGLNGQLIQRVAVAHGASAVPPTPPVHSGYEFSSWDGDYENVTENRTVTALYVQSGGHYQQGDVDLNGVVNTADALVTLRHVIGTEWNENVVFYGDVNGDGAASIIDAMLILRCALGFIEL